jgi:hypothetical protein
VQAVCGDKLIDIEVQSAEWATESIVLYTNEDDSVFKYLNLIRLNVPLLLT